MRRAFIALLMLVGLAPALSAQDLQSILQTHAEEVVKPSRSSVGVVLDDLVASGLPQVLPFLEGWQDRRLWQRDADGLFFLGEEDDDILTFTDIDSGDVAEASADDFSQLRPNGGVRRVIATALVQFQLTDPDLDRRTTAVESIARRPEASQLGPLVASIDDEPDAALKARKEQLANFLSAQFAEDAAARIAAINNMATDTSVENRGVLNRILSADVAFAESLPEDQNVARTLVCLLYTSDAADD